MAIPPQQILGGFLQTFNALPNSRKMGVVVALAAVIAVIVGMVLWSRSPEYRVLFSNLSERDAGSVVAALEQMNVPHRTEAGGAILVPSDQVYDLRFKLASQGLPKGGAVGFELMDSPKLGMTQFQEQVTYQRALEGELARTVQSLAPVEAARVHLAIPKPSVFIRDRQKPSASVLVNLYAGRTLDQAQVSAIVHLVSSSVPQLSPGDVTVVDQAGNLLTARMDGMSARGLNASELDFVREVESTYARRIEAIVAPIVGDGNVKAEVSADLDFSESEFTSESFKPNPSPETQAVRSLQTLSDTSAGTGPAAGVPGAFSNQPPGPATAPPTAPAGANAGTGIEAGAGPVNSSRRESTTNFELDKTIRHVREPLGRIKRLSVAVVVNYRAGVDPAAKPTPLSGQELDQVNNLVREAMGFNSARGDTVNVVNAAFSGARPEETTVPLWKDPENVALAKELLKNLLMFGFAFYLVFGVLRPLLRDLVRPPVGVTPEGERVGMMVGEEPSEAGAGPGERYGPSEVYADNLASARAFAQQNPKIVADVVRDWMARE